MQGIIDMQNMKAAVRSVLSNYATFSGRASRPEFWWWILAIFLLGFLIQLLDAFIVAPMLGFEPSDENAGQPLSLIFSLAILIPAIAVAVRRLHDAGKSGWWLLLSFVPIIGTLILLWFYTRPSDGPNDWGAPNPLR